MKEITRLLDKRSSVRKQIEELEWQRFELREGLECSAIDRVKTINEINEISEKINKLEDAKDELLSEVRYLAEEKGISRRELHKLIKERK
jgi:uncharacterized coiled-coil DUF342 family protein